MRNLMRMVMIPALVALLPLVVLGTVRAADAPVKGEVLVILAKEAAGEYDPKLKDMPALKKAPFSAFKSMTVLSTNPIEVATDKDAEVTLPNGRTLSLKLVERKADGRHKVQVTIGKPGKQDTQFTVIASGEPFFVAGQSHEGGTLVIGVRIGGAAKK